MHGGTTEQNRQGRADDTGQCNATIAISQDGNRAHRKAIDREHTAQAPAAAQTVKLADLISNSRSIMEHDPQFAVVYLAEKRLLLEVLTKGDPGLHARATEMISKAP